MDFENIIPVIIFIIFVVSQVFKVLTAKKPGPAAQKKAKKPGLKDLFGDIASQIKQEIEAANTRAEAESRPQPPPPSRPSGWDQLMPQKSESSPEHTPKTPPVKPVRVVQKEKRAKKQPPISESKTIDTKRKEKPAPAQPTVTQKSLPKKHSGSVHQNLRNAIIWSEILAPPLALRHDRENESL